MQSSLSHSWTQNLGWWIVLVGMIMVAPVYVFVGLSRVPYEELLVEAIPLIMAQIIAFYVMATVYRLCFSSRYEKTMHTLEEHNSESVVLLDTAFQSKLQEYDTYVQKLQGFSSERYSLSNDDIMLQAARFGSLRGAFTASPL